MKNENEKRVIASLLTALVMSLGLILILIVFNKSREKAFNKPQYLIVGKDTIQVDPVDLRVMNNPLSDN